MLEKHIPAIRSHIERRVNKEFGDWLVEIRIVSRNLGQLAIGQASAARQREEELRMKQRQAEEQSRLSLRDCVYALEEEDDDGLGGIGDDNKDGYSNGGNGMLGFDLTPLYRAYHIHQTLGLEDRFKQYYFENRKLRVHMGPTQHVTKVWGYCQPSCEPKLWYSYFQVIIFILLRFIIHRA